MFNVRCCATLDLCEALESVSPLSELHSVGGGPSIPSRPGDYILHIILYLNFRLKKNERFSCWFANSYVGGWIRCREGP